MEQSLPLFQVIDGHDTFCDVKVFDCIWCSAELVVSDVLLRQSIVPYDILDKQLDIYIFTLLYCSFVLIWTINILREADAWIEFH